MDCSFAASPESREHTHVPAVAIVLQSVWTIVVALSGRYEQILNYVVSMDFLFFGLTGASLFVFRDRAERRGRAAPGYRAPGHPLTTAVFVLVSWLVVINTIYKYPKNSLLGMVDSAARDSGVCLLGCEKEIRRSKRLTVLRTHARSPYMEFAKLRSARQVQPGDQRHHELSARGVAGHRSKTWRSPALTSMATLRCESGWQSETA